MGVETIGFVKGELTPERLLLALARFSEKATVEVQQAVSFSADELYANNGQLLNPETDTAPLAEHWYCTAGRQLFYNYKNYRYDDEDELYPDFGMDYCSLSIDHSVSEDGWLGSVEFMERLVLLLGGGLIIENDCGDEAQSTPRPAKPRPSVFQ